MEKILHQILESVAKLSDGQIQIVNRLDTIDNRLEVIEDTMKKIDVGQQEDVIAMLVRTATKDSITDLDAKFDDVQGAHLRTLVMS